MEKKKLKMKIPKTFGQHMDYEDKQLQKNYVIQWDIKINFFKKLLNAKA